MYNELFSIGPFTVHMYGLMIAIGVIAAYVTAERRAKKKGLNSDKIFDLVIWCLIFGFLGSKILYCLTTLPSIIADPMSVIRNFGDGWVAAEFWAEFWELICSAGRINWRCGSILI